MRGMLSKFNEKFQVKIAKLQFLCLLVNFQMQISRKCYLLQTKNVHFPESYQYRYQIKLVTNLA